MRGQSRLFSPRRLGQRAGFAVISMMGISRGDYQVFKLTVEISPRESSSPARILRKMRRMILPERVFGRSSTTKTFFGAAKGPIDFRT